MDTNQATEDTQEDIRQTEESTDSLVSRAERAAQELKKENDRKESLLLEEKELRMRQTLGGNSAAGTPKEEPKEETPTEYKDRVMRGQI